MTLKTVQQTTSNYHQAFPLIIYERKLSGFLPQLYNSFEDGKFDNSTGKITGELNGKVLIHQDTRLKPFFREMVSVRPNAVGSVRVKLFSMLHEF